MFTRSLLLIFLFLLAACSTPAPDGPDPTNPPGWVELEDELNIDEAVIERVTPAPVEPVTMSQAEAQAALPFAYALPAWAPDGFVLQDDVEVVPPASVGGYASISLTWLNPGDAVLQLQVAQADADQPALSGAGSTQAVNVNGQPAALVTTRRFGVERLALTWPRDGLTYTLTAEAGAATPDDLRRMAESVA